MNFIKYIYELMFGKEDTTVNLLKITQYVPTFTELRRPEADIAAASVDEVIVRIESELRKTGYSQKEVTDYLFSNEIKYESKSNPGEVNGIYVKNQRFMDPKKEEMILALIYFEGTPPHIYAGMQKLNIPGAFVEEGDDPQKKILEGLRWKMDEMSKQAK